MAKTGIANRGFASMTPERRSEIARMGAEQAKANGTAHRWTSAEAAEAGRRGGTQAQSNRRAAAK